MVYNEDTLVAYHEMTSAARINYQQLLESKADDILWEAQHPIKSFLRKAKEKLVDIFN